MQPVDGPQPVLRAYRAEDFDLVMGTWLWTYRKHAPRCRDETYFKGQRRLIIRLIEECDVAVMASSESEETVLGWAVGESGKLLHYLHVKDPFRRLGIARQLLSALSLELKGLRYTHATRAGEAIMARFNGDYDPWALVG